MRTGPHYISHERPRSRRKVRRSRWAGRADRPMRVLVLRAGDVVPNVAVRRGEFAEFIERGFGESGDTFSEIDLRAEGAKFTARDADAFVVTGSSSSVTERAAWMERACDGLRAIVADGAYLLGLCFGHQLIGHAFGGEVALNPRGREIGTVQVRVLEDDPLFAGLGATFPIQATHTDSVVRLPRDARVLAETALEPVAAFAIGERVRCVQFHPELDDDAILGYLEARADRIRSEGLDPDAIRAGVKPAPAGHAMLKNFRNLVSRG